MSQLPTIQPPGPLALPVVGAPGERADAARNRDRIICAAARLFAEQDPNCVSMDAIAAAAGVGKGTLFRRFGDRAGLMRALLDESETAFQDAVIRGAPPLGPGASAIERLVAFAGARFELLEQHGPMLAAAEASERGDARFDLPVYVFYRSHILMLVREADAACDADYLTEVLLAPLAATQYMYERRARGMSVERITAGYEFLVRRLLD